ncbi:MAG: hypothetical protein LBG19_08110 [Prevotellaceae bacterium]|jgi:hypothetical protein|nr:hypothetical protein [Prevotellaceae bacterium]
MELILQILMLFIILNSILKLSFWKLWQAALFGVVCGGYIILMYPYAIEQSKTQLADYLNNAKVMQDMAVLITLESSVCYAYCFLATERIFGDRFSRWGRILQCYVSLLLFPVLFYLLTQTIFNMPGTDFSTIAYGFALGVVVLLPLLSYLFGKLLPESDFRLEIHFLASLFVCILGLITTVNGNVAYAPVEESLDIRMLTMALSLFIIAFVVGYGWNKLKWVIPQKKGNKKAINK